MNITPISSSPRLVFVITVVLAAVFFVSDHDLKTAQLVDFFQSTDQMEQTAQGGNLLRQVAFFGLAALGVCLLVRNTAAPHWQPGLLGQVLVLYVGWCVLSIFWSDEPAMTLRRTVVLLCAFVGALGIARNLSLSELCHVAICVLLVFLGMGLTAELGLGTFQPWSNEYRFAGSVHPNTQATYMATLCLAAFALGNEGQGRMHYYLLLCLGLTVLLLTKSRTALAGTLLVLTVLWTLTAPSRLRTSVWLAGIWTAGVAAMALLLLQNDVNDKLMHLALLGRSEKAESLSGRIPLWSELMTFVQQRPLLGYGYDSFWSADHIYELSRQMQWPVRDSHSAYIETLLNVGAIGIALLAGIVALAALRAGRLLGSGTGYQFLFGLLLYAIMNAGLESLMTAPTFIPFIILCGVSRLAFFPTSGAADERDQPA